jgi:hypothetical protein
VTFTSKPYNGYTAAERNAKGRALRRLIRAGAVPRPSGRCSVCGDRQDLVYHAEDYSRPYVFAEPAQYVVCRAGHAMIHLRFHFPDRWRAFTRHVRAGGTCREFARPAARAGGPSPVRQGELFPARAGRAGPAGRRHAWWERLSTDARTLTDPRARPRP